LDVDHPARIIDARVSECATTWRSLSLADDHSCGERISAAIGRGSTVTPANTKKNKSTKGRATRRIDPTFDSLPEHEQLMLMALSVLVARIRSLQSADRDDLFELLQGLSNTDDPEEIQSIRRTMEEILSQAPTSVKGMDLRSEKPMPRGSMKWAERVGKTIRERREEAGLNQAQLAEKAGLTQSHVSRLECASHVATNMTLQKIAAALGIPVRTLDPCID
jgi:DNA-binding XRE family transcriptional regulator